MGLGASFARLAATTVGVCALVACGSLAENGTGDMGDGAAAEDAAAGQSDASGVVDDGSTVDSTLPGSDAAKDTGTPEPADGGEDARDTQPRDAGGDSASIADSTLPEDSGNDTGSPDEDTGTTAHDSGTDTGRPEDSGPHDSGAEDTGSPRVDSGQPQDSGETVDSGETSDDSGRADTGSSDGDGATTGEDSGQTIPDGGLPPTPGEVACGDMSCGVPQNQCCISLTEVATCVPSTQDCFGGITVGCNEASDCPSGDVCCVSIVASAAASAQYACQAGPCGSPAAGHAQACRTNQECIGGAACTVQDCEGLTVELCGLPKFDNVYQCTPE